MSETCRISWKNNFENISASCWFYYKEICYDARSRERKIETFTHRPNCKSEETGALFRLLNVPYCNKECQSVFYKQAMRVLGTQKGYWILLSGPRANNWHSRKRKKQIHTVTFGFTTWCSEHVAWNGKASHLNRGSVVFVILAEISAVMKETSCNFPQSFQSNFEISGSNVSFNVFWHNFPTQGAGTAQSI
jgi:hypothetical protein